MAQLSPLTAAPKHPALVRARLFCGFLGSLLLVLGWFVNQRLTDRSPYLDGLVVVDLKTMDRTILREPSYQSSSPRYCLLVLGPEAKRRLWLVHDQDRLFVDLNGNGDLTESGEQFSAESMNEQGGYFSVPVRSEDGRSEHRLQLHFVQAEMRRASLVGETAYTLFFSWPEKAQPRQFCSWGDENSLLLFGKQPQDAPILHLGGPLQMGFDMDRPLVRNADGTYLLSASVGNRGSGPGSFAFLQLHGVPSEAYPMAVVEFPNREPEGPPLRHVMFLKQRSFDCRFQGTFIVPEEVGQGDVKIELGMMYWEDGEVEPAHLTVTVADLGQDDG